MIILDNTPLLTWEVQRCISRLEIVIFSTDMCIFQTRTYLKLGTPWDWNFKFSKCKNEIFQRIELKDVIRLVMFTSKVIVIRISKMAHLMYFQLNTENNRPSLGKIFKCIWNVLVGPFTKYYGFWSSDLPLPNCQHLKIQDLTSSLLNQHFYFILFIYLFIWYFYPQYLTNSCVLNLLNMPFSARTRWDLPRVRKNIAQTVTNFLLLSGENKWN